MTAADEHKLDVFVHTCLRRVLKIYWPTRMSNEEVRRIAGVQKVSTQIRTRRWKYIGHMLRLDGDDNQRVALRWTPANGKRREGEGGLEKHGGGPWRGSVNCWALIPGRGLLLWRMTKTAGGNSLEALLFTTQEETGTKSSKSIQFGKKKTISAIISASKLILKLVNQLIIVDST